MGANTELTTTIATALLESANIARVIDLEIVDRDGAPLVCAKVDLSAETTMREVSTILYQARRRVELVLPEGATVYLEPEVWVDPNEAEPTTSSVVMLGLD